MKKLFQNKSFLKSIQIFLVCLVVLLLPKSLVYADTWTIKEPMTSGRVIFATAEVNGKIYAFGTGSVVGLLTVEEYDLATDIWTPKSAVVDARRLFAAVAVNSKIYVIGGYSGGFGPGTSLKIVEEYDPLTDTWVPKASMINMRAGFAAAAVGGKIYVIGGNNGGIGGITLKTVEEYDPATDTWTTKSPMPTARLNLAAATVNSKIYVIGGYSGGVTLSTVEEYDPATDTWTMALKSPMPTARWGLVAAAVNNKIYAIGGHAGGVSSTVEEYDPATDIWIARPFIPMPTARYSLAAVTVNNKIYAMGGFGGTSKETEELSITVPPPTCTLTASPAAIFAGNSSTLKWTTADADTVEIDDGSGVISTALNSSKMVFPTSTTTYTLTATNASGVATCSATVAIVVPPPPPLCDPSLSLFCNPLKSKTNSIAESLALTALYLLSVAGVITLAFMVIAGIRYIISAGNQEKMKSAKDALFSAGSGLAIIVLSYAILSIIHGILSA